MKLITYEVDKTRKIGVLKEDEIYEINKFKNMNDLIENCSIEQISGFVENKCVRIDEVRFRNEC